MPHRSLVTIGLLACLIASASTAWAYDASLAPWGNACAQSEGEAPGCGGGSGGGRAPVQRMPSAEEIAQGRAFILWQEGLDAFNKGDYETALKLYQQARDTWPQLAYILSYINRAEAAISDVASRADLDRAAAAYSAGDNEIARRLRDEHTESMAKLNGVIDGLSLMPAVQFVPSGNALIGGMGWEFGYNVPPGSDPALVAKAQKIAARIAEAEGYPYNEKIDFQKYNFVLGLAASTNLYDDLTKRVVFDEFRRGQFTATQQNAYNSIKGRQFDVLACHSNGAMICLAALENNDVGAKHIVLFGPQITPESLYMWDELVRRGHIASIQIYINQGDPVPAVAMLASAPAIALAAAVAPVLGAPIFNADVLSKAIGVFAPSASVKTFACSNTIDPGCHDMKVYKVKTGACPASSGDRVPGTAIRGRDGVIEPPPPC